MVRVLQDRVYECSTNTTRRILSPKLIAIALVRSPFTPNTKHCDDCTECDRLS
ncbi:hypothetical protein [Microcoleus sp.]|uniref:hypothetical protein n=1 Tax=Microcoleus sp. TaxID=44472 RepID=UPI00352362D1